MDGVGTCLLRRADVFLGVEISRDLDGLVGRASMQRIGVVRGGHGHGPDVELAARTEDANGDLAAVGYEQLPGRHEAELRD
ncbi:MAG: hypothetical protein ABI783_10340 [Actinomycetota bacterium]